MSIPTYHLADFLSPGQTFFIGWTRQVSARDPMLHQHDFAEFFWVQHGECLHVTAEGDERLSAGDFRFVRPAHIHGFQAVETGDLELVNVALPADVLDDWEQRYPDLRGRFFWSGGTAPGRLHLESEHCARLGGWAIRTVLQPHSLLTVHRLLLDLFIECTPGPGGESIPLWLREGLQQLTEKPVFSGGVSAFARACHRSQEHVSRACRRYLNQTASDVVNDARLAYATRRLRLSDDGILDILYDCGLSNPSHFYKLFRGRYGMTPRQYRTARWV